MKTRKKAATSKAGAGTISKPGRVPIRRLPTGVRGLDEIVGGGIPEFSFNIITGGPGCGKTTLAHQILFANATRKAPALYFTILGEPPIKMLRYQQQYSFFDPAKLNSAIRFINLGDVLRERDLNAVFAEIAKEVSATKPRFVVVDSFRSVEHKARTGAGELELAAFVQRLAEFLTSWEATTFLIGEYEQSETQSDPVFTVADGLFRLTQVPERDSVVRKLQIQKLRGQASVPGLHTIRIGDEGMQAFSRTLGLTGAKAKTLSRRRASLGIPELDKMFGGGIFMGDSLLVAGPTGSGKSAIATQFIEAGLRKGEAGVMAIFEERPQQYAQRAGNFGLDLKTPQEKGKLKILYLRPLDLSVDETMVEILDAIAEVGAKRLVIDSLAGFEMALAPGFRTDFRESLYRMIGALTGAGVTILSTVEVEESFQSLDFSHYSISFLTDDIVRLRYVEIDGQLRKIMVVVKMRGANHSKDIREYIINDDGVVVISPRKTEYQGLITGIPTRTGARPTQPEEAAPEKKATK
jgi:circadian clock protein KaiC